MDKKPPQGRTGAREERLAKALRANLKRRKAGIADRAGMAPVADHAENADGDLPVILRKGKAPAGDDPD